MTHFLRLTLAFLGALVALVLIALAILLILGNIVLNLPAIVWRARKGWK